MKMIISACQTDWGWVGTAASSTGLLGTTLPKASKEEALLSLLDRWPGAQEGKDSCLVDLHGKLQCYFSGRVADLSDIILDVRGATGFQVRVREAVRAIPRGQVRSYSWVAHQAGSPQAARAVGRALATNPLPVVVPCHRVVGKGGQLTGFAGGLDVKRRLLEMETASMAATAS